MNRVLLLAWRYVAYHRIKSTILILCVTLTIVLPLTAHLLVAHYGASLTARADATPLLVGARGNRFDLVLKSLYFGSAHVDEIRMSEVDSIRASELATPIPLHLRYTARGYPLVGTTLDYLAFRDLRVGAGTPPLRLGQAVLGAAVASDLRLGPGDTLFSDQRSMYDISKTYPLKMHIAGVLQESGSPDDQAVFVDIKTAWIIDGIAHGHQDVIRTADESVILKRDEKNVATNAAILEYNEVTAENIGSFHIHAAPRDLPLSAVLVLPVGRKAATLLQARYNLSQTHCMLVPGEVVEELISVVFKIKRFFDTNFALILVSDVLFIALVVLLSRRIRKREMETMRRIGCSRWTVFRLQAMELGILLVMSLVLAGAVSLALVVAAPRLVHLV